MTYDRQWHVAFQRPCIAISSRYTWRSWRRRHRQLIAANPGRVAAGWTLSAAFSGSTGSPRMSFRASYESTGVRRQAKFALVCAEAGSTGEDAMASSFGPLVRHRDFVHLWAAQTVS